MQRYHPIFSLDLTFAACGTVLGYLFALDFFSRTPISFGAERRREGADWPRWPISAFSSLVSRAIRVSRSSFSRGRAFLRAPDGTRAENRNRRRTQRPRGRHATPGRLSLERRVSRASDHVTARSRGARRGFLKPRSLSGARVEEAAERLSEDDAPGDRPERGDVRARGG